MSDDLKLNIREMDYDNDTGLIYSSYLKSLGAVTPYRELDKNWYSAAGHLLAERFSAAASMLVASDPDDPTQIYGWIAADPASRVLYWLYVKSVYRRAHVGTQLMLAAFGDMGPAAPAIRCAHWTPALAWQEERWHLIRDSHPLVDAAKGPPRGAR